MTYKEKEALTKSRNAMDDAVVALLKVREKYMDNDEIWTEVAGALQALNAAYLKAHSILGGKFI